MATGTYAPWFLEQFFDDNGDPLNGGTIETFVAGTSTAVDVYTDVNLSSAYSNPLTLNSAGRLPSNGSMFLTPGVSYKFVIRNSSGTTIASPDHIGAVPGVAGGVETTGTAGEALTAGQAVYLSDGSGAKTAGLWYKADSANSFSSTTPWVGIVPANIAINTSGAIRLSGQVTGLSSLTVGGVYYIGTAGAITTTAPTNRRAIGQADTTSSLVLDGNPPPANVFVSPTINTTIISNVLFNDVCHGRLTLTTGVPVTTADVTGATTLFFTPYCGNNLALYDGATAWTLLSFTELSIAVPSTTVTMYDVFVFNNSGIAALELTAWTNDTTRATALTTQNGVPVKSGATTRRYLGSMRTTSVSGQTEDSFVKRFVWNYNQTNRASRILKRFESTDSWTYSTATYRQANASASNQVETIVGVAEVEVVISLTGISSNSAAADNTFVSISDAATTVSTTPDTSVTGQPILSNASTTQLCPGRAELRKYPSVGHHVFGWLEQGSGANTTTWYGDNGNGAKWQAGLLGAIPG